MEKYLEIANEILNLVDRYSDLDMVCENGKYVELQHWVANIIKENFNS